MKSTITVKHDIFIRLRWAFMLTSALLLSATSQSFGQLVLSSPNTTGAYTAPQSITLSPGFSTAPGQTFSAMITAGCAPLATALSRSQNYVVTYVPREANIINPADPNNSTCQVMASVQYIDGLGRPLQNIQIKGSANATKDVVQPIAYDAYGREQSKYLPYTTAVNDGSYKPNALNGEQYTYYNSPLSGVVQTPYPFSQTVFEPSPLNRAVEQGAPGNDWQPAGTPGTTATAGHTIKISYGANAAGEVMLWQVNGNGAGWNNTYYNAGQLYKTTTADENGNQTIEYKDKEGKVVCKKVQADNSGTYYATSYVYSDLEQLAYVVPQIPTGIPQSFTETDANFTGYIYAYHYDERSRAIQKKLPGKEWEYTVYNQLDQVVLSQDGNHRLNNQWIVTKYDAMGRVIISGLFNDTASPALTQAQLQSNIYAGAQYDSRNLGNPTAGTGYSLASYPALNWIFVLNFYDDYNIPGKPYNPSASAGTTLSQPTGLLTASKRAVLLPDGTFGPMLWEMQYYDDKGRTIQTDKQHYLGGATSLSNNNYDETILAYNFNNQVTQSVRHHYTTASLNSGTAAIVVTNTYSYDHMGRKIDTREAITTGNNPVTGTTLISELGYNDVGQLTAKHLGNNLQQLNYTYNERGWLRTAIVTNAFFNFDLAYNNPEAGVQPQYNGNIAEMLYHGQSAGDKTMKYSYDNLNRLTGSVYTDGSLNEQISYDPMGNISQLIRGGAGNGTLNYTSYTGNQLNTVIGYSPRSYAYDANGNATSDGISKSISYNFLNLPGSVGNVATYTYDANGTKLGNTGSDGSWDYDDGIVYNNGTIKYITNEEGRATQNGGIYTYQYDLKDQLGDVRVTFDSNNGTARVLQEDEYYAFGLRHSLYDNSNNNRHLYNGKEIQTDLANQYDYGARFYDPVIARWNVVDPIAEMGRRWSPYAYGKDNPVKMVDPDGMWAMNAAGTGVITTNPAEIEAFVNQMQTQEGDKDKSKKDKKPQTGSYTNQHVQGKYHGKGGEERAAQSAKEKAGEYNDPHVSTDWTPADNDRQAFKDEDDRINTDEEGHKNPGNYNKVKSPGAKYKEQDKKSEEPDAPSPSKNFSPSAPGLNPVIKKVVVPAAAGITIGTIISYLWPVLLL